MAQILSADQAVRLIPDGATVLVVPAPSEEVYPAFHRVFTQTGSPSDLTVIWSAGLGPFSTERRGMNHFAYPGMVKRIIAGHIGLNHEVVKMIAIRESLTIGNPGLDQPAFGPKGLLVVPDSQKASLVKKVEEIASGNLSWSEDTLVIRSHR